MRSELPVKYVLSFFTGERHCHQLLSSLHINSLHWDFNNPSREDARAKSRRFSGVFRGGDVPGRGPGSPGRTQNSSAANDLRARRSPVSNSVMNDSHNW
jgi:hypothetical protein